MHTVLVFLGHDSPSDRVDHVEHWQIDGQQNNRYGTCHANCEHWLDNTDRNLGLARESLLPASQGSYLAGRLGQFDRSARPRSPAG